VPCLRFKVRTRFFCHIKQSRTSSVSVDIVPVSWHAFTEQSTHLDRLDHIQRCAFHVVGVARVYICHGVGLFGYVDCHSNRSQGVHGFVPVAKGATVRSIPYYRGAAITSESGSIRCTHVKPNLKDDEREGNALKRVSESVAVGR
jgi:hypothetical protein